MSAYDTEVTMAVPGGGVSFEEYVVVRWRRLVRSGVLMGLDLHSSEDAVQTTLTKCFLSWEKTASARDIDAYVHRVLINTIADGRRRRWRGERPTDSLPETSAGTGTDQVDEAWMLVQALRSLPEAQRAVVVLRFYADLSELQTAQALGIAVGTVKSRSSRALAALAQHPSLSTERGDA